MTDADITYRWLTQAELDAMLDEAFSRGAEAMRQAAAIHCATEVCSSQIRDLPLPKANP